MDASTGPSQFMTRFGANYHVVVGVVRLITKRADELRTIYSYEDVDLEFTAGCLIVSDESGVVAAFAPGEWYKVERQDPDCGDEA